MSVIQERLSQLEIELPDFPPAASKISMVQQHENMLYCSGAGPLDIHGKPIWTGKLGADLTQEEGYLAARQCAVNLLGRLQEHLGDLDRIRKVIKVFGLVASAPDFYGQPEVMHGATDFITEVFGETGLHARMAAGTNVLPMNIPVEVEMIVAIA